MSNAVSHQIKDGISHIRLDDGKANALSPDVIKALHQAFDDSLNDSKVVVLSGRGGFYSAGFDLKVIKGPADGARALMNEGVDLFLKLFGYPKPVISACTGHGIAAGAILLMCSDFRIGAEGDFKIGLNEVAISLDIPPFLVEIAQSMLARHYFHQSIFLSQMYSPKEAIEAGFLDRVEKPDGVLAAAQAEAKHLAEYLDLETFKTSKMRWRSETLERINKSRLS